VLIITSRLNKKIFKHVHAIVKMTDSFIMSVHLSAWNNLASSGWIFMNSDI